ncbi:MULTISPECIES: daunorubicin/doxorubicin resistance ABC transporter ATP-binding protein DrrA [unclassified Rhodococcus (in: high G+C Gram-positive bacteria)]|uniref:daunorubicin/doxorubicin resistance ABC transporter ATP-binding protein DrrA n=1 Tax=unclassified Rhodococcus (in: high G+C Gram-positive bacteria) TaxID=192944 RepID=UPI0006F4782E|nr:MULTISPECIES: daunorubicin/doxorubicin resistance ABC transporter ATP-binding protein DrrA [unclassified Rhodococcus (in: high G+C Gram-positive bacteria)]KQU36391.1 IclR family transcriptional regulator [Rhodococcus sp. Leaf225]KQU48938.1 IclR family transcriptional regulator [Rhodococcus sp. Leaf258]
MPTDDTAVLVEDVHKSFGSVDALQGVDFSVEAGTILGILGPNGAGKTTTVKVLATLIKPDRGRAIVAGHDVARDPAAVRRSILMTGQYAAIDDALTGRENLVLFGRLMGLTKKAARVRAENLLHDFDLLEAGDRPVRTYSGGMRRRIDIACGLVVRPKVVFLDEPTTGLDPRSRKAVWSLVASLREQGITTLLTTQYLEEADVLSDSIIVIDSGRVIANGTADELKSMTGGNQCHIVPLDPADLRRAADVLAGMLPPGFSREDLEADSLTIPAPNGPSTLTEALKRLDAAGIELSDIGLRRPSLDDVFLSLTGRPSEVEASPGTRSEVPTAASDVS